MSRVLQTSILVVLAATACELTTDAPAAPETAAASIPATASAPAPAPAPATAPTPPPAPAPAAAADLSATRLAVPFTEVSSDALRAALEGGGWQVGSATATRSSMLAINVSATKGETRARINYYNPGEGYWLRRLERDGAAIHREGDVVLGVAIEGNPEGAQTLLRSLVGG